MSDIVLQVENLSKQYRLGQFGTGTLSHDLNRWWYKMRGKEDPYLKVGEENDRSKAGEGDYVWSLKDINFQVKKGEVLGIIGKNGAGKSTLLKILSQVTLPSTGEVRVKGRIAALLEVGTGFHPELTGKENIFLNGAILGMTKSEIGRKFDEIVDFSGVARYIDTPVKRYSSGMLVRLGFAVAAHLEPEILIVDEVLAVGDLEFQKRCLGKMKDVSGQGRTVLFVSHNMGAVRAICSSALLLQNGKKIYEGSSSDVIKRYTTVEDQLLGGGLIPSDFKRLYGSRQASFTRVQTINTLLEPTISFGFRSGIGVLVSLDVHTELENIIFSLSVVNDNQEKISYWEYPENSFQGLDFNKGKYSLTMRFRDSFLPGDYYLSVALMRSDGHAIDFIERISPFSVTNASDSGEHYYKWNVKHGNSYMTLDDIQIKKTNNGY
jgi:lipopolysaccharide transport system ATP-binding protein